MPRGGARQVHSQNRHYVPEGGKIEDYIRAETLYRQSVDLQKQGKPEQSTQAYLAAMEIHAHHGSVVKAKATGSQKMWNFPLPVHLSAYIFSFVGPQKIEPLIRRILSWKLVSKSWRSVLTTNSVWFPLYKHVWGSKYMRNQVIPVDSQWYYLFKWRTLMEREFRIMFVDIGFHQVRYKILGHTDGEYKDTGPFPTLLAKVQGHYWGGGSGINQWMVGEIPMFCASYLKFKRNFWEENEGQPQALDIGVFVASIFRNRFHRKRINSSFKGRELIQDSIRLC